jgi:hypothetical protein
MVRLDEIALIDLPWLSIDLPWFSPCFRSEVDNALKRPYVLPANWDELSASEKVDVWIVRWLSV